MSHPMFPFVPHELLPRLSKGKPYSLLLLKKGEKYNSPDAARIIQAEHLPHLFRQQDEGVMCFSIPVMDNTELAGIALYTLTDKEAVKSYAEGDPAVKAGVFTYEIWSCMGLQGDSLK